MPKKIIQTRYYIGTSGWNYSDWRNYFYPPDLPQKKWLEFYQQHFSIVEINATFYRLFNKEVFLGWRQKAKRGFHYIIKVNRMITHVKYLKNVKPYIKKFCQSASLLDKKLALVLLQLPPRMPYDLDRLNQALSYFKNPKKVVVEFRHTRWLTPEAKALLKKKGCIFCAADSPSTPLTAWATSKTAYIRLHGRKVWFNYKYSQKELREIAHFAQSLEKQGARKIYILFNNDYYAYAIENALTLQNLLIKKKPK